MALAAGSLLVAVVLYVGLGGLGWHKARIEALVSDRVGLEPADGRNRPVLGLFDGFRGSQDLCKESRDLALKK